jgi:hypothetical protein
MLFYFQLILECEFDISKKYYLLGFELNKYYLDIYLIKGLLF